MLGGGIFYLFLATLIISGALALVEIIRKKNPDAAKGIEALSSFSGWVGLGLVVFCVITLLDVLRVVGLLFRVVPVSTIVVLASLIAGIVLGLLQLVGLLKQFGVINDAKAASMEGKLASVKIPFGFIAIISAIYLFVWTIIKWQF